MRGVKYVDCYGVDNVLVRSDVPLAIYELPSIYLY